MKHNEIVEIAKQAGIETDWSFDFQVRLETFAKLVAQHEREACAKVCDSRITDETGMQREDYENRQCAIAIRARGQA